MEAFRRKKDLEAAKKANEAFYAGIEKLIAHLLPSKEPRNQIKEKHDEG